MFGISDGTGEIEIRLGALDVVTDGSGAHL